MTTPHKHAVYLHAIAEGQAVEYRSANPGPFESWKTLTSLSVLDSAVYDFRVRPHRWQREIDAQKAGQAVQGRRIGEPAWFDQRDGAEWDFDRPDSEFRIKPNIVRFRVAAMRGDGGGMWTHTADDAGEEQDRAAGLGFICWLGDWQEVEVTA